MNRLLALFLLAGLLFFGFYIFWLPEQIPQLVASDPALLEEQEVGKKTVILPSPAKQENLVIIESKAFRNSELESKTTSVIYEKENLDQLQSSMNSLASKASNMDLTVDERQEIEVELRRLNQSNQHLILEEVERLRNSEPKNGY